jgi:hypothetical protein
MIHTGVIQIQLQAENGNEEFLDTQVLKGETWGTR